MINIIKNGGPEEMALFTTISYQTKLILCCILSALSGGGITLLIAYIIHLIKKEKTDKTIKTEYDKNRHYIEYYDGDENLSVNNLVAYLLKTYGKMETQKCHRLCWLINIETLIRYEKPIFTEPFYRWNTGPVCKAFLNKTMNLSKATIQKEDFPETADRITKMQAVMIDEIINFTKHYDSFQISQATYQNDFLDTININEVIPDRAIADYYNEHDWREFF